MGHPHGGHACHGRNAQARVGNAGPVNQLTGITESGQLVTGHGPILMLYTANGPRQRGSYPAERAYPLCAVGTAGPTGGRNACDRPGRFGHRELSGAPRMEGGGTREPGKCSSSRTVTCLCVLTPRARGHGDCLLRGICIFVKLGLKRDISVVVRSCSHWHLSPNWRQKHCNAC